ncbi:Armadillo repeat-containing protein 7 [Phytophthora boehmeriae]|uniref:Armadillo repeat-containing protein 7 n=1 Tax=Phytophthora boehmeriae TaxID=109152 RepID=A0A8T1WRH7_9STRA|nr:Armadillo repeat-containing protein 7 [Phytophthora boehmeriae]
MLSSRERLQERQGQYAAPRHEYLQQLVDEFQRSPDILRKEEVVANLANFAYDPINYASLGRLRTMDLFLDILDADQEQEQDAGGSNQAALQQQGPATTPTNRSSRKYQLVEFALGGICNCIPDPQLQQQFIDGDGVEIVAPYVLDIKLQSELQTSSEVNISVSAVTIMYFLLDSSAFPAVTTERFSTQMSTLQLHPVVQIANTAAAFLTRHQELLATTST